MLKFGFECVGSGALCGGFSVDSVSVLADNAPNDSDGDGVADAADQCPTEAGTAANNGCPDVTPSKACDTAKAKLKKAKATLKKLKADDAPKDKLKKAKGKVKKAKGKVKKACKA